MTHIAHPRIRSVYEMESLDDRLYIIGPGPSAGAFPLDALKGRKVLALNSAIELVDPTWWMWSDKKFSWLYRVEISKEIVDQMIVPFHQALPIMRYFKGSMLWIFTSQMQYRRYEPNAMPAWYAPTRLFLPGRCSVASCAMSLAYLLKPVDVVLIGIDFDYDGSNYYASGITKNVGPTDRRRALDSGFNWFRNMSIAGWPDLKVLTVCKSLANRVGSIEYVDIRGALDD